MNLLLKKVDPEVFYEAIGRVIARNTHGAFLQQHTVEEYKKMRSLFLSEDGQDGVAVTDDHSIISVFSDGPVITMEHLMLTAIQAGGDRLDNYDNKRLSKMYESYGFIPVSKCTFNDEFAPADWNYERDGRPDIIFWMHNGDSAECVEQKMGHYEADFGSIKTFDTYEQAKEYRDAMAMKNRRA